jgi:hypothetical protein
MMFNRGLGIGSWGLGKRNGSGELVVGDQYLWTEVLRKMAKIFSGFVVRIPGFEKIFIFPEPRNPNPGILPLWFVPVF